MKIAEDSAKVRIPPPGLYLGALIVSIAVERLTDWLPPRARGLGIAAEIRWPVGLLFAIAGLALIATAAGLFRRAGTSLPPWQPTTALVTTGVYGWTRNPMYLGMTLAYVGLAIAFDSLVALVLLAILVLPLMRAQVIAREERYIEAKFGEKYRAYKARVRRWL